MATITTHILNGVDGSHAAGLTVRFWKLRKNPGARVLLVDAATDSGGRLKAEVNISDADPGQVYEMEIETGGLFDNIESARAAPQICRQMVLRFTMPDPGGAYHMPVILSPNSYSVWWSG